MFTMPNKGNGRKKVEKKLQAFPLTSKKAEMPPKRKVH